MSDERNQLYQDFRQLQDRHSYFLLASAGTAIGYALTRSEGATFDWNLMPLVAAIVFWGFSFYAGCKVVYVTGSAVFANMGYLNALNDPTNPYGPAAVREVFMEQILPQFNKRSQRWRNWQLRSLLIGALLYSTWQLVLIAGWDLGSWLPGQQVTSG